MLNFNAINHDWFGRKDKDGIIYRSWLKNEGMPPDMFDGRPVIGICNTYSELTPCNAHFREHGDWWLANLEMESALKFKGYEFKFEKGSGTHSGKHGGAILPESLIWLWSDIKTK